jgi:hypothetical protein
VIAEHEVVAAASSERVLPFLLQEATDVGQIGGRKSAAAAEGVDWRRRRRGKVRATTRCVCVRVDSRIRWSIREVACKAKAEARQCNAMQHLAWAM